MKGLFISFEGCEGCGKSTLLLEVQAALTERKVPVLCTREPGGTLLGEKIRNLLLHDREIGNVTPQAELLLFLASRAEHAARVIEPALSRGEVVLSDRYIDSTVAYQAYGRERNPDEIFSLSQAAVPLMPDLTLCLDIDFDTAQSRLKMRQGDEVDKMEAESRKFHERVRKGFIALSKKYPQRIALLDGRRPIRELLMNALELISKYK